MVSMNKATDIKTNKNIYEEKNNRKHEVVIIHEAIINIYKND